MAEPNQKSSNTETSLLHFLRGRTRLQTIVNCYIFAVASISFLAAGLILIGSIAGLLLFFFKVNPPFLSSENLASWVSFSNFAGFVSQALVGVATISGALLVSLILTTRLENQKRNEQAHREAEAKRERKSRELIRLSEKMVDTEFYVKVMYPAWEVALKWFGLKGEEGARYRAEVIGGQVRLPKAYSSAQPQQQSFVENSPRSHPHYVPYDHEPKPQVINELSESLAFATWVRFWRHVQFLIDAEILDARDARDLFGEWYLWWAPFMTEFVALAKRVAITAKQDFGPGGSNPTDPNNSINKLMKLHKTIFKMKPYHGHSGKRAFNTRIDELFEETYPLLKQSVEQGRPSS